MRRRAASTRSAAPRGVPLALAWALVVLGCVPEKAPPPRGVLTVSVEQEASWLRNFNPLTPATAPRWPTWAGIYEPLYVFSTQRGFVPWLATAHTWREDNLVLRVTLREGVTWSDGAPFTARDVEFTFQLLRRSPALDRRGVWAFLREVRATSEHTVDFRLERVFFPALDDIVAQLVVPEHIWKDIADPVAFANPNPVATGPFTEVRLFRNQIYELGKNPRYWQPGKPKVEALRFPAFPSNDRANLALIFDEVDWAANFVPAIDRVFVGRDREHHRYWFPLTGSMIFLYANTTRRPLDDPRVRKAISMAIDRDLVVAVALYNYSRPADPTGMSDAYASWRDPQAAAAGWTTHDVGAANRILDEVGLRRGPDGKRRGPDGQILTYQIMSVSGWSDWVRAAQVIARGLRELGIDASVRTLDFGAWSQKVQEGRFDLTLGWSFEGPTPYTFYRWLMASDTVKPEGTVTMSNWHRYGSPAADRILAAFETEATAEGQRALATQLQRTFAAEAPAIPLYPNPSWGEFNTRRFAGFPSAEDAYADPSPNRFDRGEVLLVLTTLEPR